MTATLFGTDDDELLISVYARQGRTLDDLPYTPEFEAIYEAMTGGDPAGVDRASLFHRLHNIRKAGRLPKMGRAASKPPKLDAEHEAILTRLVEAEVSELSKRDQLLYTAAFDTIVTTFNARAGLNLSPHDVWRVVAKLAK